MYACSCTMRVRSIRLFVVDVYVRACVWVRDGEKIFLRIVHNARTHARAQVRRIRCVFVFVCARVRTFTKTRITTNATTTDGVLSDDCVCGYIVCLCVAVPTADATVRRSLSSTQTPSNAYTNPQTSYVFGRLIVRMCRQTIANRRAYMRECVLCLCLFG